MAFNFNWFIKITRSFGSGFQNQDCKAKSKIDHDESKSKQTLLPDQIKEHFGLWTGDSPFIAYSFFSYVSIMFIMTITVALTAWPSRSSRYCFLNPIPTPNPSQHLLLHVVIFGAMLTPGFFPFFSIDWVENSIAPREISIASTLCSASFRSTAEVL